VESGADIAEMKGRVVDWWPTEEIGRGEKRRERARTRGERCAYMWAPPSHGIHVSKTTLQNHPMDKYARY
jgi:hypothetical protein